MMRDNDFEGLVNAKSAIKSKIGIKPSQSTLPQADNIVPPDEEPDDVNFAIESFANGARK